MSDAATNLPRIVVTGASGFLGRHLLAAMKNRYRIFAMGRRSPTVAQAPTGPGITWYQVDIADAKGVGRVFREIAGGGGAEILLHLAAHYDFTGEDHPEYRRTNVDGMRNVLDASRALGLRRFVFASSLAASRFPPPGRFLDEASPTDGEIAYARTKHLGETMLREYEDAFPTTIVRLAALFSDYCEYPPLFFFLGTWLSRSWKRRLLAGRGESAVPYLHIRDAVSFFQRVVDIHERLPSGEVLIAGTDGAVPHRDLFEESTLHYFGRRGVPVRMPRLACRLGLHAFDLAGRLLGDRPFERPWMGKYIDLKLSVNGAATRRKLRWAPNPRLRILRRMPFLVENYRTDPLEWNRRNWAALRKFRTSDNLRIHDLLEERMDRIVAASLGIFAAPDAPGKYPRHLLLDADERAWTVGQLVRQLMNAARTREMSLFRSFCRDLARRRYDQGFPCDEVVRLLSAEADVCLGTLREDPVAASLEEALRENVTMTFRMGIDEVQDVFEELTGRFVEPGEDDP